MYMNKSYKFYKLYVHCADLKTFDWAELKKNLIIISILYTSNSSKSRMYKEQKISQNHTLSWIKNAWTSTYITLHTVQRKSALIPWSVR